MIGVWTQTTFGSALALDSSNSVSGAEPNLQLLELLERGWQNLQCKI